MKIISIVFGDKFIAITRSGTKGMTIGYDYITLNKNDSIEYVKDFLRHEPKKAEYIARIIERKF